MSDMLPPATLPAHDYQLAGAGGDFLNELKGLFSQSKLLEVFDDISVEILADYMQVYRQSAGRALLREGEKSDFVILLLDGDVDVLKSHDDGMPQLISTVTPGKLIGEMSLVDGEPRFATCIARNEVLVAVLTRQSLLAVLEDHPRLGALLLMRLVSLVSQRLRQTSKKLVELMSKQGRPNLDD